MAWGCGDFGGGLLTRRTALFGVVLSRSSSGIVLALVLAWSAARPCRAGRTSAGACWPVAGGVGISALYQGLAVGRMGVVAPVTGVMAALIPVAAGIVLEGVPPPLVLVGIALAIVAVVLVSRVSDAAAGRVRPRAGAARPASASACSACHRPDQRRSAFGPLT